MAIAAVESALAQDYPNLECIVVDDGSDDGTPEAIRQAFGDQVKVIEKANSGVSVSRNMGAEAARGEFITWMDDDDLAPPERVSRLMAKMTRDTVLVGGAAQFINTAGEKLGEPQRAVVEEISFELACIRVYIPGIGSNMLARKSAFLESGGFDASLSRGEDMDLQRKMAEQGNVVTTPDTTVMVRVHDGFRNHGAMDNIRRCREQLLLRTPKGAIRRRAKAWMHFTFFERYWDSGQKLVALSQLVLSFLSFPASIAPDTERARPAARRLLGRQ